MKHVLKVTLDILTLNVKLVHVQKLTRTLLVVVSSRNPVSVVIAKKDTLEHCVIVVLVDSLVILNFQMVIVNNVIVMKKELFLMNVMS